VNGERFLFYAAFIPGLQNCIADAVKERLSDAKIHKLLDGAVIFETETGYDKLNFFCFNNIFAVIDLLEGTRIKSAKVHGGNILNEYINSAAERIGNTNIIKNNSRNIKSFRIVVSNENVPAAIDENIRAQAEKRIARLSGLKVNRSLPDTEFWFLYRSEGFFLFMKRLTLRHSWDKTLHKGELPPPLAWTLCRLARLKHGDTVLDPFCGYGSIPDAALKHFHLAKFVACDNSGEAAAFTVNRIKKRKTGKFYFYDSDFRELPSFLGEKNIDAIVTDPPWGIYKEYAGSSFPEKMFDVFSELLKDGGRAVVLYANDGNFIKAIPDCFMLEDQMPILLSGKKAVIYSLKKKNEQK